ncbi:unnamed protein product [Laminaria digitata]
MVSSSSSTLAARRRRRSSSSSFTLGGTPDSRSTIISSTKPPLRNTSSSSSMGSMGGTLVRTATREFLAGRWLRRTSPPVETGRISVDRFCFCRRPSVQYVEPGRS